MADGLPDRVDCARLAADAAVLDRVYRLQDLPRLEGLLAGPGGTLEARIAFTRLEAGRIGAHVRIRALATLECQRCMRGFEHAVEGGSEVEFAEADRAADVRSEREVAEMTGGQVSLRDLAEEEMLLALPLAPRCPAPAQCAHAPATDAPVRHRPGRETEDRAIPGRGTPGGERYAETQRPFVGLQDLLKKTR